MATRKTAAKRAKRTSSAREAEKGVRSAQRFLADLITQADPESVKKSKA